MDIDTIIFDWDGTLVKTLDLWLTGYGHAFEKRGQTPPRANIVAEYFYDPKTVIARHPDLDFKAITGEALTHVRGTAHTSELYDESHATLRALSDQGITLSLVSSSYRTVLETGLSTHALAPFFHSVIAGDDGFGHKPDPGPFRAMLDRLGASAPRTLVIGDSHVDIEAGKALGCRTCRFMPAHNVKFYEDVGTDSVEPCIEIACLSELATRVTKVPA